LQKLDRFSSLFWIGLSLVIAIHSYRLGIGSVGNPGPGFIFFYAALFIALMAILLLVGSWTKREEEAGAGVFENVHWVKVLLPFAYILLYALALEKAGFIISTFLLIFLLLKTIEAKGWPVAIFVGLTASLGTYAMFELWLRVRLPKGILGF
jgi:putative tricarboxylic transport membrane protein